MVGAHTTQLEPLLEAALKTPERGTLALLSNFENHKKMSC